MGAWASGDIPDLRGKTAVVTGANSGLGFETSRVLASRGAKVILACRDQAKGETALARIFNERPGTDAAYRPLDLADLASVMAFAATFKGEHDRLDILINNAGVMNIPYGQTADGFELQFGTNHLGHFALTGLLLDEILAAQGARVVMISSLMHRVGRMEFDNLDWGRGYTPSAGYGRSKLANLLFARELARRVDERGLLLTAVAVHPGYTATHKGHVGSGMRGQPLIKRLNDISSRIFAQDVTWGALPTLYAAVGPDVPNGAYFGPDGLFEMGGRSVKRVGMSGYARDDDAAKRLWEASEKMTGISWLSQ